MSVTTERLAPSVVQTDEKKIHLFTEEVNILPAIRKNIAPIGIKKFKKLAGAIKTQQRWTKTKESDQPDPAENSITTIDGLSFNVKSFKANGRSSSSMSKTATMHLKKPPSQRTAADLKIIIGIVDKLKSFAKYPQLVREELAKVVYYESYADRRVIVRQGDTGLSFYFIISGGVSVEVKEEDPLTGQLKKQVVAEMFGGEMFGEVSLLHNIERTATIACKGNSEFLRIDKPDFDMVLKTNYENEWSSRVKYLESLPQFKDFTAKELQQTAVLCKIVHRLPNKVVETSVTTLDSLSLDYNNLDDRNTGK